MINKIVTHAEYLKLISGLCPDCGAAMLLNGPRGGLARNVLCGVCRTEFNVSPVQSERIAKPCAPARQREVYHIDEMHYPVAAFPDNVAQSRKQLDKALTRGCQDPTCTAPHKPLTEIYLQSNCHNGAGLCAAYQKDGKLVLTCRVCHRLVVIVDVAP
jgi:hypothetical protein